MRSNDGGDTWRSLRNAPIAIPVAADDSGAADRITLDDEFESHTWLSSFCVTGGKIHFLYLAQTNP